MVEIWLRITCFAFADLWLAFGLQMEYAKPTGSWKWFQAPAVSGEPGDRRALGSFLCKCILTLSVFPQASLRPPLLTSAFGVNLILRRFEYGLKLALGGS